MSLLINFDFNLRESILSFLSKYNAKIKVVVNTFYLLDKQTMLSYYP